MLSTIGVTGGIGSGKSLACHFLERCGAHVFAADQVARTLMECAPEVRSRVQEAFGQESYLPEDSLNRSWLASRVFGDADALKRLNDIVHPAVREAFQEVRAACTAPLLVHEAALIYESGADQQLDAIVVIAAPLELRLARVMERDDVTEEQVRARMHHQLPAEELERRADVVVTNTGDPAVLNEKMRLIYALATAARPLTGAAFKDYSAAVASVNPNVEPMPGLLSTQR